MVGKDEEKTAFHTSQGVYYYTKMPFDLKNVEVTYQQLVDNAFERQVGRNLEVYVDDLMIKSHTEQEILRDIKETFNTLRRINMKLNLKKCTFRVEEGTFLGHIITTKRIRACPKLVWDNIVCRFGLQGEIISDNGKQFKDNPFKDCETSNRYTPFSLTYGMEAVIPVEIGMPSLRCTEVDQVQNDEALLLNLDMLEERREKVIVCEAKNKAKMERYYNSKVRRRIFKPGDFVYRSNKAINAKESEKLGPKWEGPCEVIEALEKGAYRIRNSSGDTLPRTWNIQDSNKCYL
ncbi:reverse transcriptase domain-containing protein [Tanacetum coccineum]